MRLYVESSAVLTWLLGEDGGDDVRRVLGEAAQVFTSALTLVETDRVLIRAQVVESLGEGDVIDRRRILARASRHWHLVGLHQEVLDRARRPFAAEPIRTLDALHLASALVVRTAVPELAILTLDVTIRNAGTGLGFQVLPQGSR